MNNVNKKYNVFSLTAKCTALTQEQRDFVIKALEDTVLWSNDDSGAPALNKELHSILDGFRNNTLTDWCELVEIDAIVKWYAVKNGVSLNAGNVPSFMSEIIDDVINEDVLKKVRAGKSFSFEPLEARTRVLSDVFVMETSFLDVLLCPPGRDYSGSDEVLPSRFTGRLTAISVDEEPAAEQRKPDTKNKELEKKQAVARELIGSVPAKNAQTADSDTDAGRKRHTMEELQNMLSRRGQATE